MNTMLFKFAVLVFVTISSASAGVMRHHESFLSRNWVPQFLDKMAFIRPADVRNGEVFVPSFKLFGRSPFSACMHLYGEYSCRQLADSNQDTHVLEALVTSLRTWNKSNTAPPVCLDFGANAGLFTLPMAALGCVTKAFEIQSEMLWILYGSVLVNRWFNLVKIYPVGISNAYSTFEHHPNNGHGWRPGEDDFIQNQQKMLNYETISDADRINVAVAANNVKNYVPMDQHVNISLVPVQSIVRSDIAFVKLDIDGGDVATMDGIADIIEEGKYKIRNIMVESWAGHYKKVYPSEDRFKRQFSVFFSHGYSVYGYNVKEWGLSASFISTHLIDVSEKGPFKYMKNFAKIPSLDVLMLITTTVAELDIYNFFITMEPSLQGV